MFAQFIAFFSLIWGWLPGVFCSMLLIIVFIRCADSIVGIIDRAWRLIGR